MDHWTERLSEYLDETLEHNERLALEAHLRDCTSCREVLDDLGRVVARASGLDDRPPAHDLWPAIAREIGRGRAPTVSRRVSFSVPQLLAAGVALVLLSAGAARLVLPHRVSVDFTSAPLVRAAWTSDPSYDAAVADLQAALEAGRKTGRLDSATVRVVERNLAVIDSAIAEARRALGADPGSAYLNQHLAATMRRKLDLLRRASAIAADAAS